MRKCAAILCAALVTVSACACGKDPAPTKKTDVSRYHISTTTTTTPTANYAEKPSKSVLNLTAATAFSDGVAFVRYADDEGVEHAAAINTEGKVLFELPEGMPFDGPGYVGGIRVVDNVMYDKTGAVIASPELSGYDALLTGNCGGYVLAKKTEVLDVEVSESTDSTGSSSATTTTAPTTAPTDTEPAPAPETKVSIGVLNSKGKWEHALSADHPIAKAMAAAEQPTEVLEYVGDGVLRVYVDLSAVPQYYHFADNTLTVDYVRYASFGYTPEETAGIYKMAKDGSKKLVIENVIADYFFADAFIGRSVTPPAITETEPTLGALKLYDYEGKELMDLSAYTIGGEVYYQKGHLTFLTTDEVGSRLLMVLSPEGNPVFEPVVLGMRDHLYAPDDNGLVVESYTATGEACYRLYDYVGEIVEYTDVTAFAGFFDGLAAVTLRGDTEHRYYINHRAEIVLR